MKYIEVTLYKEHKGLCVSKVLEKAHSIGLKEILAAVQDKKLYLDGRPIPRLPYLVKGEKKLQLLSDIEGFRIIEKEHIIFEDSVLLVANKPSGLSSQKATDPLRDNFFFALRSYLAKTHDYKKIPYLALHHRLDYDTSGVMVFCKQRAFNKNMSDLFAKRQMQKTYLALVEDNLNFPDTISVRNRLDRSPTTEHPFRFASSSEGAEAETRFQKTKSGLVMAFPKTGRSHQLRVHLSELGHPILGDIIYHPAPEGRLALHAYSLKFKHPESGLDLEFLAPLPKIFEPFAPGGKPD